MSNQIRIWHEGMTANEGMDIAYWERNVLALRYADGWYNDDVTSDALQDAIDKVETLGDIDRAINWYPLTQPRFKGWRRVLSLDGGKITFHIPDNFDVGSLPEIEPNWDEHTTEQKWRRILADRGIES